MNSGVYTITQHSTGKRYVGSSVNLQNRKDSHYSGLRRNAHDNSHLQHAFNKYGEADFDFRVLLHCDVNQVLFYEQRALDILTPEFNILRVAGNSTGRLATPETRAKISAANQVRIMSPKARTALLEANLGRPLSAGHRAKLAVCMQGNKHALGSTHTADAKAAISSAMLGNKHSLGYKHSSETLIKMSLASTGRKHSQETRDKMSAAKMGNRHAAAPGMRAGVFARGTR